MDVCMSQSALCEFSDYRQKIRKSFDVVQYETGKERARNSFEGTQVSKSDQLLRSQVTINF